jgi:D-alanyl-D-alanine carboxypeptidase
LKKSGLVLASLFLLVAALGAQTAAERARLETALEKAKIPAAMAGRLRNNAAFYAALKAVTSGGDRYLRLLVDKGHPLPSGYEPADLRPLRCRNYRAGISDPMALRAAAEAALEEMGAAAAREGVVLTVSSAYRSYEYQVGSFDRWTKRLGRVEAERVSAQPGRSQHQLGLVVDFGGLENSFAQTRAGLWVKDNASRFGWSLSYPEGYEDVTGYAWESWHYRYVGTELAAFIDGWFGGIQQYALAFIYEWENAK